MFDLTKSEAFKAMKEGKKVTREYFGKNEHLWMDESGVIRSEEGYPFNKWWNIIEPSIKSSSSSTKVWRVIK